MFPERRSALTRVPAGGETPAVRRTVSGEERWKDFGGSVKTKIPPAVGRDFRFGAERTRFELVVPVAQHVGLANRWFQPLTHLSNPVNACRRFRLIAEQK